ncbi:cupin [Metarhizobium album]|uniref:Cupin n=1 Tax=Metarhizobium album TaxID=2182425 RepID=A0A2U2DS55_9HYPH|nr:cupin domain-containing protein [Rhizobium album]PWE56150.1 cupin [Rhizobium album]
MVMKVMLATAVAMAVRTLPISALTGASRPLVSAPVDEMEMKPSPIEPSWIIEGEPQARSAEHSRSADEAAMTALWDCTAGTFRWYFHWDETVVILEGEVHVTAEDGSVRLLRAGDIGYFSGRTWATWRVDEYVKKIAFVRKPFPGPVAAAYRLSNFLRARKPKGFAG